MEKYKIFEKKILIYGAGSVGKVIAATFSEAGIDIEAYIDKRADTIKEVNNKTVFSMERLQECIQDKDSYAIVCTIRNVFEHSSLAEQFFLMGFKNLIYKPITILRGNNDAIQDSINYAYEQITGKFTIPKDEIACYEKETFTDYDYGLHEEFDEDVLAKLPAEMLFSNTNPKTLIWSCQNFYSNYIAVNLYEAFSSGEGRQLDEQLNRYVERFALPGAKVMGVNTDGAWREILIDSRQKVYHEMEYKLWMDYDFFIRNCTKVGLRKGKGFELISSGKNRVSFLIAKGFRYIPVKISKEDYKKYLNETEARRLISLLNKATIKIFAPIPHPFFYRINVTVPDYAIECVKPIAGFLAEQIYLENNEYCFSQYRLGVCMNDEGYISRYFKMLGYAVERRMTQNQEICALEDQIFYYDKDGFVKTNDNLYCSIIANELQDDETGNIISRTSKFLIVISSFADTEYNLQLDEMEFSFNKKIFATVWEGKIVEGNLYERLKLGR